MFRQRIGKFNFKTGKLAIITLKAERRIGAFQSTSNVPRSLTLFSKFSAANVLTLIPQPARLP
jgi:hypothetical protein